jgi:hypothetical protein
MRKITAPKSRELFIADLGRVSGGGLPDMPMTTLALGEEDGGQIGPTTEAIGEEDGGGNIDVTTLALGEEDGGGNIDVTTLALGEEDGGAV